MSCGSIRRPAGGEKSWGEWYLVREKLVPTCAILAMFGMAVGMGAGAVLAGQEPRRPRPYWLFVPLAALAGVLFVAVPGNHALVPQYILLVLDLVNNSMPPSGQYTSRSVSARALCAGIEAVPATLAIVGLALVVVRDFQRAGRSVPWATTRGGWFVRLLALAAAGGAGIGMALVAVPTLCPMWAEGFRQVLGPEDIVMVLAGFGTLSAGLAARTVVPRPVWEKPRWLRWLSTVLVVAMMGIVAASALKCLPSSMAIEPEMQPIFARLLDEVEVAGLWFWGLFPYAVGDGALNLARTGTAALDPADGGPGLFRGRAGTPSVQPPFDLVASSPGRLVRFAWLTLGLTVVCLAALPTLIVLGQVILHIRLCISTWMVSGWPSPF